MLGCANTTVPTDWNCPPPNKPDSRLLEHPSEFEVLEASNDKEALPIVTRNGATARSIRDTLIELQLWVKEQLETVQ